MSTASLAVPPAPMLDAWAIAALRRWGGMAVRGAALLGGSITMAAFLWLVLAGPGFATDRASTVPVSRARAAR